VSTFAKHDIPVNDGIVRLQILDAGAGHLTPLVCLHPAPFDGSYYTEFAALLGEQLPVIAPDYPGYGESTSPAQPPRIDDYASLLIEALDRFAPGQTFNLLGFHTGCLIGCEMALQSPAIHKLVLIDAPCFAPDEQIDRYAADFNADDASTWGFGAAFSYPCMQRLPQVANPALIFATGSNLNAATHHAAGLLANSRLEDCPDVGRPALRNGGPYFAGLIADFLPG